MPGLTRAHCRIAVIAAALLLASSALAADGLKAVLGNVHWGQTSQSLEQEFGAQAIRLPRPLDFGDSYAEIVLRGENLGGVPVALFFQMDKATHGLKRVQLEPLAHETNPRAFRAMATALARQYGRPDQICTTPPVPAVGYQASIKETWLQDNESITAIFRDTTLEAFEGCLYGPAGGWCGLHGQILVRIAPSAPGTMGCMPPAAPK